MKKFTYSLFFLAFLIPLSSLYGQGDYIVTIDNKTIENITIVSYPKTLEQFLVNVYNDNLMPTYEDLKIIYTSGKNKRENKIDYNKVSKFSTSGVEHLSWHSRKIPLVEGKILFDTIVESPGKTKDELYALARSSLILGMSLTADQIQKTLIEDKESGSIMVKKLIVGAGDQGRFSSYILFDLLVRVKDGKARMTIGDIKLHYAKGEIFNDAAIHHYEVKGEEFATNWRRGSTIRSHYYKGVLILFYTIEDVLIKNFVGLYTKEQPLSDW